MLILMDFKYIKNNQLLQFYIIIQKNFVGVQYLNGFGISTSIWENTSLLQIS